MPGKIGEEFFREMIDRGRRELGGLWPDSNIAQPMYPLRGYYGPSKEADSIGTDKLEPSFEELHPVGPGRDDHGRDGRDNPDRGIERE
jgi:hypothetical protein